MRAFAVLACLLLGPACSLTERRLPSTIESAHYQLPVAFWAPDRSLSTDAHLLFFDTLLWPIDAVVSFAEGVSAMVDDDYAVRAGPFGFLAAVLLPGVTLETDASVRSLIPDFKLLDITWHPATLPIHDAWIERWQRGEIGLPELAARAYANACRAREDSTFGPARYRQAVSDVGDGRIAVTLAGELRLR